MKTKYAAHEALLVFGLIMTTLWVLPRSFSWIYYVLFLFVVGSWIVRGDSAEAIGLLPRSYDYALLAFLAAFLGVGLFALMASMGIGDPLTLNAERYFDRFNEYILWGFFQQLILNGYFALRFYQATESRLRTTIYASGLFAIIHLPNPVLTVITLFYGMLSVYIFIRNRNLFILALLHALLGASLGFLGGVNLFNMRVGPGYLCKIGFELFCK